MKKNLDYYGLFKPNSNWHKFILTMKITAFLLFCCLVNIFAAPTYSQATKISLNLKDATIEEVLNKIENESEFYFLYNNKLIDVTRKVNIEVDKEPIKDILNDILNKDTKFIVYDRQIILTPSDITSLSEAMQQLKISGTVVDKNGSPMPGVNVVVTGTTHGAITDIAGKYSIEVPPGSKSLHFSFIGMDSKEISIGALTQINVTMAESAIGLNEVVVIGYGTVKKADVTGSVSSLTEGNLSGGMVINPQQAMEGKISGVNITLNGGAPGANSSVLIRGGTSINASNAPLYVIDGVPVSFDESNYHVASLLQTTAANNPLNMINVADIKSIDILKDASATAIYGSRGANGVIIITTKQGIAGNSKISYDTYVGVSKIRKKLDVLTGDEFRSYINAHPEITNWVDGGTETDWQDQIFRTAISQSHTLSFSSGNSETDYRASVNYSNEDGIVIKSGLQRMVAHININQKALNDRLDLKFFLSGMLSTTNSPPLPEGVGSDHYGGVIRDALLNDPTYPVKDDNGVYTYHSIFDLNPVEEANTLIDINETFRNIGNLMLNYKLTKSLVLSGNVGYTKENVARDFYAPISSKIGETTNGMASVLTQNNNSKLLETNLTFAKVINETHNINAMLGYSWQEYFYTGSFNYASNFISDATTFNNLGAGLNQYPVSSYKNSNRLISFFGRATYDFKSKYLITATIRRDGSSRFGANDKWGIFPSGAIAWKLTEEEFLKDNNVLSNLKLRAGYGITGNQAIGDYLSQPTLSAGGNLYIIGGTAYTAVGANQYYNPDLKWESTAQMNIGLDFGLLKNRISGSIDLYNKKTTNLLLTFPVPSPAEVGTTTANVGSLENKGIELELNGTILSEGPLKWTAYANLSHNVQKVTSLSNETWNTTEIFSGGISAPGFGAYNSHIIEVGEPLGIWYGYKYLGVDKNGVQQFKDVNGDGQITPGEDGMVIGSDQPDLIYGFGSKISYRGFSFDFFFRGIYGIQVLNATALDLQIITRLPAYNILKAAVSDGVAYGQTSMYSSEWIQNASFLRLDNVTLGYNFNLKSTKLFSKLYLYISGQNLFVLTKYSGYDPEVPNGQDYMQYPKPQTFLLGLSVDF